jgi:hypothetical protein
MGRLADQLSRATTAIESVEFAVGQDVKTLIARTEEVHKKRQAVFLKKHAGLDAHVTDLAEFDSDLDDFGKNDHSGAGGSSSESTTNGTGDAYVGTSPPNR